MKLVWIITKEEWRQWLRSNLALGGMALFAVLLIATSVLTALRMEAERHDRLHQQAAAEHTFLAQPDRHPHRMVHYGHYVFRAPAPLAAFDPGLDPVTGQSIFLEGHQQNSAMFADTSASANLGGLSWLTPALVYQIIAPLFIIVLGHGTIVREREASTLVPLLAQGVSGRTLLAGKGLALMCVLVIFLLPIIPAALLAMSAGESGFASLSLLGLYMLYLSVWGAVTLLVSLLFRRRSAVLTTLTTLWLVLTLLVPSIAVNLVSLAAPVDGKIETDLLMLADLRKLGDGHNANDPAFVQLRADLLRKYDVDRVEDLPVNVRGIVSQHAEEKLTKTLNAYAEARMAGEAKQAAALSRYGWLSPALAVGEASRAISGADLEQHHRFLREAEQLRYDVVQALNGIHANQLAYADDINRSRDTEAERRTRVAADNWAAVLNEFRFDPAPVSHRLTSASPSVIMLVGWFGALVVMLVYGGGRVKS